MEKPKEPNKEDCCNSGCNPCIFDIYEKQLKLYEKFLQNVTIPNQISETNGISQLEYTQFVVTRNMKLCNSHYLIRLKRKESNDLKVWWKPGDHFLFKYISEEKSCTRAYTPINMIWKNEANDDYDFSIIVKKYEDGVVSSYICSLVESMVTLWRGPYGHYEIKHNKKYDRIIMIAQGTGIAPFISIINCILNNEEDMTKIILLYCCKSIETILFRDELYAFNSYWNFSYEIYVSLSDPNFKTKYREPIITEKMVFADILNLQPFNGKEQFLICGSQDFNKNFDIQIQEKISCHENIVLF